MVSVLGTDLKIDEWGDIQITPQGDVDISTALPNMYQSLRNRFVTEKGGLVSDEEYGILFDNIIGAKNLTENINQFKLELIKQLKQDRRITAINNIQITPLTENGKAHEIVILLRVAETNEEVAVSFVFPFYTPDVIVREVTDERQWTIDKEKVRTEYTIHRVLSVRSVTDFDKTGTNFYTGGYILADNKTIILGTPVTSARTPVFITYETLEVERLGFRANLLTETVSTLTESVTGDIEDVVTYNLNQVRTSKNIYDVVGIWDTEDVNREETNYYYGGNFRGTLITLGTALPSPREVVVEYFESQQKNGNKT